MAVFPFWCCCGREDEPPPPDECVPFNCVSRQCTFEHPSTLTVSAWTEERNEYTNFRPGAFGSQCNGTHIGHSVISQQGTATLHSKLTASGDISWHTLEPVGMRWSAWVGSATTQSGCALVVEDTVNDTADWHFSITPSCCSGNSQYAGEVFFNLTHQTGLSRHPDSDIAGRNFTQILNRGIRPERIRSLILTNDCGDPDGDNGTKSYTRSSTVGCTPGSYSYNEQIRGNGFGPVQGGKFSYNIGGDPSGPQVSELDTIYARVTGVTWKTDCFDFQGTIVDGEYTSMPVDGFNRITSSGWVAMTKVTDNPPTLTEWEGSFTGVEWADYDSQDGDCDTGGSGQKKRGPDNMLFRLSLVGDLYTMELFSDIDDGGFYSPPGAPFFDRFFVKSTTLTTGCGDFDVSLGNELTFSNWDGSPASEPLDGTLTLDVGWGGRIRLSNRPT